MLGEDHMWLITYGETHTRVTTLKGALLDHSETSRRSQCTPDIDISNEPQANPALLAHIVVKKELGVRLS
jgi:hypothetical protein